MVVIRLARSGSKKRPFFYIVATDKRNARDGRYIEQIGYFNPIAAGKEVRLKIELDKIDSWVAKGAQLSERVGSLVKEFKKSEQAAA